MPSLFALLHLEIAVSLWIYADVTPLKNTNTLKLTVKMTPFTFIIHIPGVIVPNLSVQVLLKRKSV